MDNVDFCEVFGYGAIMSGSPDARVSRSILDWHWFRSDALRRARAAEASGNADQAREWYMKKRVWSGLIIAALAAAYNLG